MTTHVNRKVVVVLTGHMEGGFLAAINRMVSTTPTQSWRRVGGKRSD